MENLLKDLIKEGLIVVSNYETVLSSLTENQRLKLKKHIDKLNGYSREFYEVSRELQKYFTYSQNIGLAMSKINYKDVERGIDISSSWKAFVDINKGKDRKKLSKPLKKLFKRYDTLFNLIGSEIKNIEKILNKTGG